MPRIAICEKYKFSKMPSNFRYGAAERELNVSNFKEKISVFKYVSNTVQVMWLGSQKRIFPT